MSSPAHERRRPPGDDGFTIIEVMVAMLIMIIGVLGTFTLLEGSMSSTARTTAREQGTNLARDLVERSRQVSYGQTSNALAPATLRATLPALDGATTLVAGSKPGSGTFDVTRRGVLYSVTIFACSVDDPTDGVGLGDSSYCADSPGATTGPGSAAPGLAPVRNVLGIDVGAVYLSSGGSLLTTVCSAVQGSLLTTVTSVVSTIVPLTACPSGAGGGSVPLDGQPDDLRRIRMDVSWTRGGTGSLSQTTLLTNPRQT